MQHILIYRQLKDGTESKRLVARCSLAMSLEAEFATQQLNKNAQEGFSPFKDYKYTFEIELAPPNGMSNVDIQVDTTGASPTKRPIVFNYSYHVEHGKRVYIAYHTRYGTVRGICDDSSAGDRLFAARIKTVWPNADYIKH